jgi:FkbM family methyltransferase
MTLQRTWHRLAALCRDRLTAWSRPPEPTPLPRVKDLIVDVGAHTGRDTEFYLKKGFRVVAVEANPCLVEGIRERLADYIAAGQLTLFPYGIHKETGEFTFYQNLDKDDWSSFLPEAGTRENTRYKEIRVQTFPFTEVLRRFGIPYYLKCDIEGNDVHVLKGLLELRATPTYLSVESHHLDYLAYLFTLGYSKFKIVNQNLLWKLKCPNPAREGNYVDYEFDAYTSGPFGEESPGEWKGFEETAYDYLHQKLGYPERSTIGTGWWDFHAKLESAA